MLNRVEVDKYNYVPPIYSLHGVCLCPQTNQRMSLARLQHEVEELRRRIEELKVKLTAEMKVCLQVIFLFLILANLLRTILPHTTTVKQLLDKFFVISRKIKVSLSLRLRLIIFTEILIILDITKTESNNCFIFASSLAASNTKRAKLT